MSAQDTVYGSFGDVGPQTDGTNLLSVISTVPTPSDTAGGAPANYAQPILDLFKFGISAASAANSQQQILDYRRFEATNGGLYQQGRGAAMPSARTGGSMSSLMMMGIAALVVFAVLTHKG